ncbi:MAG: AAA family ATPase [Rhodanobacteraceae bacterium]
MTQHVTLRLAWHNDGWNGRICRNPEKNTYCVGCSSFPGQMIREQRDLTWEKQHAGERISELDQKPPCMYSINAFSDEAAEIYADPPDFFKDDTERKTWDLAAASACTWPYEAMYNQPHVKGPDGKYDYDKRLKYAEEHFAAIEPNRSLVFYYANFSNPLSSDEKSVYLLVGVAKVKQVGKTLYYDNCSEKTLERYKGFVWERSISSHYPEQGVRLPYHRYLDDPDTLQKFAAVPENPFVCQYASRLASDDDGLALLEQILQSLRIVRDDVQDDSENWTQRIEWVESLVSELWKSRGAYPGMAAVLETLGLKEAISGFRAQVGAGKEQDAVEEIRRFVNGDAGAVMGYYPENLSAVRRRLKLNVAGNQKLWLDVLARCAITSKQIQRVVADDRDKWGIAATLDEIEADPYLLAEQYVGADPGDLIRWSTVDRGMLPSPELAAVPMFDKDAPQRLRALLLETLRGNHQQTFLSAAELLVQVNSRIKAQPEWKENLVTEKYLKVDREFYDGALYQREEGGVAYVYDLQVWDDERAVQSVIDERLTAADIKLPRPVGESFWKKTLFYEDSPLAKSARKEYEEAIDRQVTVCEKIFNKRLSVLTGGAGTGKTTLVSGLIRAIRKVHGDGERVAVLAPTGKAADRLRSKLTASGVESVDTSTIHSVMAKFGWLNDNLTFRRQGGKPIGGYGTLIIDECSMIDLTLMAALFRAVDWDTVRRLVLVGDAAQLPPIGVGKVYADVVSHLRHAFPDYLVELKVNLRQMENRVAGRGNGILDMADCFINSAVRGGGDESEEQKLAREQLAIKLHEDGNVDQDLRVEYWDDEQALHECIIKAVTNDLRADGQEELEAGRVWDEAFKKNINCVQILSPVRGELFGTESINEAVQKLVSGKMLTRKGNVDGFTLFDKVIQVVNRPASNPLHGWDFDARQKCKQQVFNGEIGRAVPTGNWKEVLGSSWKKINQFSVQFTDKEHVSVNYGSGGASAELNLELAYAISVHKAQGSEFERVYLVLPKGKHSAQTMELIYTALTRASTHCTVFVQDNVETLVDAMRPEQSALKRINSSLFEFRPIPAELANRRDWYEAGKIHEALTGDMVRSKSEVIIANMLHDRDMTFWYERPLLAPDGTMYLPDFTVQYQGDTWYWEHLGMLSDKKYQAHWEDKKRWYEKHFPGQLVTTHEGPDLSKSAASVIDEIRAS